LGLIVSEAIWRNGGNEIHDEIVYRTVPEMYDLSCIFEGIINTFNDMLFAINRNN
jgi:hypothetical protein